MEIDIKVIGMGPGNKRYLTLEAIETMSKCDILIGPKRLIEETSGFRNPEALIYCCTLSQMRQTLEEMIQDLSSKKYVEIMENEKDPYENKKSIGILASGDTGFFSIANWIQQTYKETIEVEWISGLSSLQYFCNRIQKPYGGIHTISVHGRENSVLGEVLTHEAVFVLTGGKYRVQNICQALSEQGLGQVKVYIGEDLSYETERIVEGRAQEFVQTCFRDLAVMLIERTHSRYYPCVTAGLPDEAFYRGQVPMTKEEVRAVCLGKLQLLETDCIYDIGAGTGSVSIEMARVAKKGFVYALEKKEEAIELCIQNQQRFELPNMKVIRAKCPEGLEHLPTPQKAFIGGSGGALQAILEVLLGKNPSIHIVVTAISLETLEEVISCVKQFELEISCTQVSVANSNKIGNYHMMMGQNPIFILTLKGKQIDE